MAQIFVSGKIGPKWGLYPEFTGFELSVVDLECEQVYQYRQQILTYNAYDPNAMKSYSMEMGFRSIYEQYKRSHRE